MRLVVDTNVFVSILIRPGKSFVALTDFLDQNATVLYSTDTLTELVDVLRRQKFTRYTTAEDVTGFVEWIVSAGELVTVDADPGVASRDSKDNKFLALAVSGRADYLISGDKDLLVLKAIGAVPIVSPVQFLAKIGESKTTG